MRKTLFKILLLLIVLLTITTVIYASTNSTKYASILQATNLGGFQDEQDESMVIAEQTYQGRGYSTFNVKDPSLLTILSNALTSQVQLYLCHGTPNYIEFKSGGLAKGSARVIEGKEYNSISSVDLTTKKLVKFILFQLQIG